MKTQRLTTIFAFMTAMLLSASALHAQVISPAGTTTNVASQLVFFQSTDGDAAVDDFFQVTNTGSTDVTVHIQFWTSNGSGDPTEPCLEDDFTDVFTPNDTHLYDVSDLERNSDGLDVGVDPIDTVLGKFLGFITVTAVVSSNDRRAIAFNHLLGSMTLILDIGNDDASEAAMGRRALSFIDGSPLADGTVLDGITGGLELLQPDVLKFGYYGEIPNGDITLYQVVNIMFSDDYSGPFGDYRSQPSVATFSPLIFDQAEVPISCQTQTFTCVRDQGINEPLPNLNTAYAVQGDSEALICPGNTLNIGWMRLAVTGVPANGNVMGLTVFLATDNITAAAKWMVAEGDSVIPSPATPTPAPSPTPTPSGGGASPSPTGGGQPGGGGGGSGCAIAGPAQAGTAAANMLIVLLPAAVFALRRRFAK